MFEEWIGSYVQSCVIRYRRVDDKRKVTYKEDEVDMSGRVLCRRVIGQPKNFLSRAKSSGSATVCSCMQELLSESTVDVTVWRAFNERAAADGETLCTAKFDHARCFPRSTFSWFPHIFGSKRRFPSIAYVLFPREQ